MTGGEKMHYMTFMQTTTVFTVSTNASHHPSGICNFTYVIINITPLTHVFIYLFRHREVRTAIMGVYRCKHMPADLAQWKKTMVSTTRVTAAKA
jgi:hypothetical protein